MRKQRIIGLLLVLVVIFQAACALPAQLATPTATPVPLANNAGGQSGGQGGGNGSSAGATPPATPLHTPSITPTETPSPSPSPTPEDGFGPYTVKQTQTLGGESISGVVCSILKPFTVNYKTPQIPFNTSYVPKNAQGGTWAYAYTLPKAGETHDANDSYTLSKPDHAGVRTLTMAGSDHVVFKSFDGKIPTRYKFDLVPAVDVPCP